MPQTPPNPLPNLGNNTPIRFKPFGITHTPLIQKGCRTKWNIVAKGSGLSRRTVTPIVLSTSQEKPMANSGWVSTYMTPISRRKKVLTLTPNDVSRYFYEPGVEKKPTALQYYVRDDLIPRCTSNRRIPLSTQESAYKKKTTWENTRRRLVMNGAFNQFYRIGSHLSAEHEVFSIIELLPSSNLASSRVIVRIVLCSEVQTQPPLMCSPLFAKAKNEGFEVVEDRKFPEWSGLCTRPRKSD